MLPKNIRTALSISVVVPALAVLLGAGSAAAADQSPAAHHVRGVHTDIQEELTDIQEELRRASMTMLPGSAQ